MRTPATEWRRRWPSIAGLGAWIVAIAAGLLVPPPLGALQSGDSRTWSRFSQFVVTLFAGLLLVLTRRWSHAKYAVRWTIVAAVSVVLTVVLFIAYRERSDAWSCNWGNARVVVGDTLTPHGREYTAANPHLTCDQIVWNHAGRVEHVWTRASIDERRRVLGRLYLLLPVLSAISIILTVHALGVPRSSPAQAPEVVGPPTPVAPDAMMTPWFEDLPLDFTRGETRTAERLLATGYSTNAAALTLAQNAGLDLTQLRQGAPVAVLVRDILIRARLSNHLTRLLDEVLRDPGQKAIHQELRALVAGNETFTE